MTWVVLIVSALLVAVAGAGVLRPFGRAASALEAPPDPMDEERASLLRTLRDLEDEHAGGELTDQSYRALRADTECRAVAVLRAIQASRGQEATEGLREDLRPRSEGPPPGVPRRVAPYAIGGVALAAVAALLLSGALRSRSTGQPITGSFPTAASTDPLAFFEQRVADHPSDVAARLDLAQRYLETGDPRSAIDQYEAALSLDPRNAEAHAKLGLLLFAGGRPNEALDAVNQALAVDPNYPEALYYRGLILQEGVDRPHEAAAAFREYLAAAPYGAFRAEVEQRLRDIEAGS